jgi:AraC-like DNA-binding protein
MRDDAPVQDPELLRRLLRAKDRMDAASHEVWPVQRLASVRGVSQAHFARSFKQAFGVPPHRYLLTRRIERALALLRNTELPITEIAFETGWESLGTFGRTFRDITGDSPSAVRSRTRAEAQQLSSVPGCIVAGVAQTRNAQVLLQAAVIGSMTPRNSVTRVAGNPLSLACSCTAASPSAR